jgi:AhpD family alkylhydroperoxidase
VDVIRKFGGSGRERELGFVLGDLGEDGVEVCAGEGPVEGRGDLAVVVAEAQEPVGEFAVGSELVGRQRFALDDREVELMTTTATSFEEPRMEIGRTAPPLHRALVTLGNEVELDPRLRELVNLRASILNGCAYCIDKHTRSPAEPARASNASTLSPPGTTRPSSTTRNAQRSRSPTRSL